jgi:hypothetical protein
MMEVKTERTPMVGSLSKPCLNYGYSVRHRKWFETDNECGPWVFFFVTINRCSYEVMDKVAQGGCLRAHEILLEKF